MIRTIEPKRAVGLLVKPVKEHFIGSLYCSTTKSWLRSENVTTFVQQTDDAGNKRAHHTFCSGTCSVPVKWKPTANSPVGSRSVSPPHWQLGSTCFTCLIDWASFKMLLSSQISASALVDIKSENKCPSECMTSFQITIQNHLEIKKRTRHF